MSTLLTRLDALVRGAGAVSHVPLLGCPSKITYFKDLNLELAQFVHMTLNGMVRIKAGSGDDDGSCLINSLNNLPCSVCLTAI